MLNLRLDINCSSIGYCRSASNTLHSVEYLVGICFVVDIFFRVQLAGVFPSPHPAPELGGRTSSEGKVNMAGNSRKW